MRTSLVAAVAAVFLGCGTAQAYQYPGVKIPVASAVGLIQATAPGGQMIIAHVQGAFVYDGAPVTVIRIAPQIPGQNLGDVVQLSVAVEVVGGLLRATVSRDIVATTGKIVTIHYPVTDPLSGTLTPTGGNVYNLDLWLYETPTGAWIESVDGPSVLSKAYVTPLFFGYSDAAEATIGGTYQITFPLTTQGGTQLNQVFQSGPLQMACADPKDECQPFQYFADILTDQFADVANPAPFFANGNAWSAAALVTTLGS